MHSNDKKHFGQKVGENIKKYRMKAGISQEELGEKCGLYRTYIGHLENGRHSPSAYILWKISKVLEIPIKNLFPL